MRVLILSCNTGEGHNAAGKAVLERVIAEGHEAVMEDIMMMAGKRTSRIVGGTYVGIVQHMPHFFQLLYKAGSRISSPARKSPVYWANTFMAKHLSRYLEENHFDIIVTPHLFPAETMTYMKKHNMLKQKVIAIATDYTCIPFWEETNCDYYILPHPDLVEEYAEKGIPREKLIPFGIPVGLAFSEKKEKPQAKTDCGLPVSEPAYLVMSGSMGFGKVNLFAAELCHHCRQGEQIVIICGHNESMKKVLERQFQGNSNVHIIGFTNQISDYMDACDVVFTKPGGLSSTEAAVKRIPIVHTAPIPGCETKNLQFFTSRGLSVAARRISDQVEAGNRLINDPDRFLAMTQAQKKEICSDSSKKIFLFLETLKDEETSCAG